MKADVIIIGAGVLGISLAYHLAKVGQTVFVLERESTFGRHASGKNSGMFRMLYRHPQLTEWALGSYNTWPKLLREHTFRQTGSMIVGRTLPTHHEHLFQERTITMPDSKAIPAIYTGGDGLLDPHDFVYGLFQLTDRNCATFHFHVKVLQLESCSSSILIHTDTGHCFEAPWVVNAAGAWLNDLQFPSSPVAAEAFARHLLVVSGWKEGYMPVENVGFYWDEYQEWYLRLWNKDSRLVSICDKISGNPDTFMPQENLLLEVAEKLGDVLPDLAPSLSFGPAWHCFRTYADDLLPVWGEDDQVKGLFWLGAFGGFGMSTAFQAAADACAYICGNNVTVCKDFLPHRAKQRNNIRTAND